MTKNIVVFASGNGSNFQALINAIEQKKLDANIRCLIVDRQCHAIERAKQHNISYFLLDRRNEKTLNMNAMAILCHNIDLIVCAGYLSIMPSQFVALFKNKIINTHPSLLPKFGGEGMYGLRVHEAVLAAGETETGCTIHYVDNGVDTGQMIAQDVVEVSLLDDPQSLQNKVQARESQLLLNTVKNLLETRH